MSIKLPKIFLDSGNPEDTKRAKSLLGFLDGQTTNPSLVLKHPEAQKYIAEGKKFTQEELLTFYKQIIVELDTQLAGPISVETYADWETTSDEMLDQAHEMNKWGNNIYIKFPSIPAGIRAANEFVKTKGSVNMTLVFDQQQAAAAYAATMPTFKPAFISPFVGRLDDRGFKGLDILKNINKMYKEFDMKRNEKKAHIEVLSASIRHMTHFYGSIVNGADILTIPMTIIEQWIQEERFMPDESYRPDTTGLRSIIYKDLPYHDDYAMYPFEREEGSLLDEGLVKFAADWNSLLDTKM